MILIKLTEEERELLVNILENEISDLRMEIADTDRQDYREMLKSRESMMKKLQQELALSA
jgi:ribosome recycling factor